MYTTNSTTRRKDILSSFVIEEIRRLMHLTSVYNDQDEYRKRRVPTCREYTWQTASVYIATGGPHHQIHNIRAAPVRATDHVTDTYRHGQSHTLAKGCESASHIIVISSLFNDWS